MKLKAKIVILFAFVPSRSLYLMIMKKLTLYLLTISLLHSLNGVGQIKLGGINIGHNQHSFEVQQLNQIKSNYYIVHVTKNISNKDASILKSNFGIELLEYIPDGII